MAIARVTKETKIEKGQWICGTPLLRDGICDPAVEVTRVSGARVYYYSRRDETENYCSRHTILFVCHTKEEGDQLRKISEAQRVALNAVREHHKAWIDGICAGPDKTTNREHLQ
jgi:hypothetical protein